MAIRVHNLAKELGVTSKAILEKCRAEGMRLKNHMSVLTVGQAATIREWFSEGEHTTTLETAERVDLEKVKKKRSRKKKKEETEEKQQVKAEAQQQETQEALAVAEQEPKAVEQEEKEDKPTKTVPEKEQEVSVAKKIEQQEQQIKTTEDTVTLEQVKETGEKTVEVETKKEDVTEQLKPPSLKPAAKVEIPKSVAAGEKEQIEQKDKEQESQEVVSKAPADKAPEEKKPAEPIAPAGPVNIPAPAVLQGPKVVRVDKPEPVRPPRRGPVGRGEKSPAPAAKIAEPEIPLPIKSGRKGRDQIGTEEEADRPKRGKARASQRRSRSSEAIEQIKEWRDKDLLERSQRLAMASDHPQIIRRVGTKKTKQSSSPVRQGKIKIEEPIILKDFCSATGVPFSKLFPKLMEHGIPATINQSISAEQAELLAIDLGIELEIVKQKSKYEELVEKFNNRELKNLVRRDPIVTFLGHVDHGKTSLLDKIRNTRVTASEAGGITQHIGAYRYPVEEGRYVVFLDTPGHEAFTSLRARGAQMTDIVVLVVAADDGVMPQTIEAISHAKAADVAIVVALNKIDLPNIDEHKVLGQLAEHGLVPAEWGGDVDVIRTSAVTGQGIDELIEHLNTLAELLDLKADPTGPAMGIVIESRHDTHRGPIADVMVQQGTLKRSDVIVAGKAYGRVRAMTDDVGKVLNEAGPACPVELMGLNEVPSAGEKFYVVENLKIAQEIAEEKQREDRDAYLKNRPRITLENIFEQVESGQVQHLNIIVKADTQGSLDALKKKLSELGTNEVKVNVLHAQIGGITEGDVVLAEASNAIVIGFCVVPDDIARSKAQQLNVEIRTYTVIYHLLEDLTAALEGLLSPTYEQKIVGRAVVRNVFKISRVGTVAGCFVTEGVIERSASVRIIRQNVIIREEASIESLKRFKDDVREVKQGFECGIKIEGFDDIKEGDVIEAYQMVQVERKLQPAGSEQTNE